jgi:hypothetical protein
MTDHDHDALVRFLAKETAEERTPTPEEDTTDPAPKKSPVPPPILADTDLPF